VQVVVVVQVFQGLATAQVVVVVQRLVHQIQTQQQIQVQVVVALETMQPLQVQAVQV
jgi:hypothetical protein